MKKPIKTLLAVSLVSIFTFPACSKREESEFVSSDELFVALAQGRIERFSSVELELGEDVKEVAWASSDESVAVIENGELVGLKAGTTVISAVLDNQKQEQVITVVEEEAPTIDVDALPVMRGYSYQMDVKAFFNGEELSDTAFSYSVADTSIATLKDNVLSGVAYGETEVTISLSWRGQENVATKTVPCLVTKNVAVYTDKAEYTIYSMDSVLGVPFSVETQVQPSVYYEGETLDDLTFTWESGDKNIATVDADGKVSAVAYGETYVIGKCEYNGETLSTRQVPIKVEKPHLTYSESKVDIPVKVGSTKVTFVPEKVLGEGYSVGKVVEIASGTNYSCTDNAADLSSLLTGEYTFVVYDKDESFSTEVNVVIADFLVSTSKDLDDAMLSLKAYVALVNDLTYVTLDKEGNETNAFRAPYNNVQTVHEGTFNGLGHTLTITYATNKRSLYAYVRNFTFKNLAIKATVTAQSETGGLYRRNRGRVFIDNCYIETTITRDDSYKIGGIADQTYGNVPIQISNTIVKVNGLDRSAYVQSQCGALYSDWDNPKVMYENVYVIAAGKLASVANGSMATDVNKKVDTLYKDEETFIEAKNNNGISFNTFNHYWDLSGDIPQFKK